MKPHGQFFMSKADRGVSRGALERIRTSDPWYRKPVLYPLSYEGGYRQQPIRELSLAPPACPP